MNQDAYIFPTSMMTVADLRRLVDEIESIDMSLTNEALRYQTTRQAPTTPITVSHQLSDFITANRLDLRDTHQRTQLITDVRVLKSAAPVVHMAFATTANTETLSKLVQWLRENVHPHAVVTIGLQPDLIGGVFMRTANKVFDFSIKTQLAHGRSLIVKELEAIDGIK